MSAGLVALLNENSCAPFALQELHSQVDQYWSELADHLPNLEKMYLSSKNDDLALLISKIYFHLGVPDLVLKYALKSNLNEQSLYVKSVIQNAVETFVAQSKTEQSIDPLLNEMIEKIIADAFKSGYVELVVGMAVQAQNLSLVKRCVEKGKEFLGIIFEILLDSDINFRNKILELLVLEFVANKDYFPAVQCYLHLDKPLELSKLLIKLIEENDLLTAYQIAFDLEQEASQFLLNKVMQEIPVPESDMDIESPFTSLKDILNGKKSLSFYLEFMYRNNKGDLQILKNVKDSLDARNSIHHTALSVSNAFMFAGTTYDQFLRENLEWLSRANNWSKFTATAALGVIHKGQIGNSLKILEPYLPQESVSTQSHSEAGSLYALGLIHAKHGKDVSEIIRKELKSQNDILQHGACLGLGLALMASNDEGVYNDLRSVLFSDSAIAGEAAAIAIGLLMLGCGKEKIVDELIQYAHDTQHEKIIRGIAVGIALIMYGREQAADATIEKLLKDKDPILRYSGAFTTGMAYAGTADNKAVKHLLHIAVSDVNDDVRRAAVIALGFLMFKQPESFPEVISLLAESYNPNVRYGSCLALGIVCAGTGSEKAIDLLMPILKDSIDFVRQGALIALGMILMQQNSKNPKYEEVVKLFEKITNDKRENSMAKFGAVLAQGILNAGGRNTTISLQSRSGHSNMSAIVGMALFTQYWYWYPLTMFLSLSFTPTAFIGLNKDLQIPKFKILSKCKPSLFDYPPSSKEPTKKDDHKIKTAVLSVSQKHKAREDKKRRESNVNSPMEVVFTTYIGPTH
eukprot:NODE_84_length_22354_cov_0.646506.p1 type:complete len:801 gc:universal NODE_84_length_22354_cov_0.646506:14394-11992(-)